MKIMSGMFIALLLGCFAAANARDTEIRGISSRTKQEQVKLFSVVNGQMKEIDAVKPAANGAFSFKFKPAYKGYYLVGSGSANIAEQDKFKLYVEGNEQISLELNDSGYLLTGKNNKENRVLEQWYQTAYKLERKTVYFYRGPGTFDDFFSLLEEVAAKSKNWPAANQTGNAAFDELMKTTVKYDLANYMLVLLSYPTASRLSEKDYSAYMKNFYADSYLNSDDLLRFPYGMTLLNNLVEFKNRGLNYDFDQKIMSIPDDRLKGDYVLRYAGTARSYMKFREMIDKYSRYFLRDDQQLLLAEIEAKMAVYKPGAKAINFSYPDVNGKLVSLSDFKGKVVLVDIWATWCTPCVRQIPWLKKLEQEFQGRDIVFLSVSVDDNKDKEKWIKYVKDGQLGGIQVLAGAQSQVEKDYRINGIPRFMLFDKNGNVIDIDAARPSNPELGTVIKKWL